MPSWLLPLLLLVSAGYLWTRLRASEARLLSQGRIDPLTGAPNRQAFEEMAEEELGRARRSGKPLTVAHLDVDDFRALNARSGQAAGDELLKTLAETLRAQLRQTDRFARTGGDEFSLLLPETGLADAKGPLEKIRQSLIEAARVRGWPVTFTIGAKSFVQTPHSLQEMLKESGGMMTQAKSTGKNRTEHT